MRPVSKSRPLRALSLTLLFAGSLLVVLGLAGSAAGDATQSTTTTPSAPSASPSGAPTTPAPTAASTAPAPAPATTSAAPQPAPVAVRASRAKASSTQSVSIIDFAFDPKSLTVHTGDTVTWLNSGTAQEGHNVTGDGLASATLHTGDSYSFTFSHPGTFNYTCTIHPDMKASVTVLARGNAATGGSGGSGGGSNRSSGSGGSAGSASSGGASGSAGAPTGSSGTAGSGSSGSSDPGSSGSLPKTGSDSVNLTTIGLMLIALGAIMRLPRRS